MVGDDIESDIGGALAAGLAAVLVRTGKYREDRVAASGIAPDRDRRLDRRRARAARGSRRLTGGPRSHALPIRPRSRARIPRHDGQSAAAMGVAAGSGGVGTPVPHEAGPERRDGLTRRRFLHRGGAVALLGGTLWPTALAACGAKRAVSSDGPLRNIVISCMENRSFDHYYGYAPQVQAAGYGPPPGYTQPDKAGRPHAPYERTRLAYPDPPHQWDATHRQWNGGKMDGFYTTARHDNGDGNQSMPYYTGGSCRSTTACSTAAGCARTTSRRCWVGRSRTATT